MQESAFRHAAHMGLGVNDLLRQGRIWALSRFLVIVKQLPGIGENIAVQTWPRGSDRLFALRDYTISNCRGEEIAAAVSSWLIVDTGSQRPVRPAPLIAEMPALTKKRALEEIPGRLVPAGNPIFQPAFSVKQSDTDIQGHVNNGAFITWIEDSLPAQLKKTHIVSRFEINYISELFCNDVIEVGTEEPREGSKSNDETYDAFHQITVRRRGDGKDAAYAFIHWSKRKAEDNNDDRKSDSAVVTEATIAACEKMACVEYTPEERSQILQKIQDMRDSFIQRRSMTIPNNLSSALTFTPATASQVKNRKQESCAKTKTDNALVSYAAEACSDVPKYGDGPEAEDDIAFAPVWKLSYWIKERSLSSSELTKIYIRRIKQLDPVLKAIITLLEDEGLEQARRADEELANGVYRGPLHGIPWGAKDLFDTAGIPTTWGASPYKERIPSSDAYVVKKLREAGAVLLAKTTLGALASGDVWFGGMTKNPWKLDQGSSGSSAGSAAATSAGLVAFALGTETMGSIVSPSLQCGTAGLRPTFGRVARTGTMSLSWSFDKIGPLCRTALDTAAVLSAINGADAGDPDAHEVDFYFNPSDSVAKLKIAYDPAWFEENRDFFEKVKKTCEENGLELLELKLPDYPYRALMNLISVDAACSFEELTLNDRDDELVCQEPNAWPNTFRAARFVPAMEYVQLQRFRRMIMGTMADLFEKTDMFVSPGNIGPMLMITNCTGSPSLTFRAGFREDGTPFGVNLWGKPYDEARMCRVGMLFESKLDVWHRKPSLQ